MSADTTTSSQLPGEDGPLPMRRGGAPITDDEALGVARRLARVQVAHGRRLTSLSAPTELPAPDTRIQSAHRLPARLLMRVRAKAEMEGRTVTSVIEDALREYADSVPGSRLRAIPPRRVPKAIEVDLATGERVTADD
ncbi:hypothetical protein GXB85_13655 [Cellulomonas sp. APG4]|uniref:hypothetical protein n=1 Tax=Cellulomonas sp. APG4 TaxID=1538656 RepID=UPI00137AED33|nr:hypothetical protein [Cellulomonas sp. APG4]NCT91988.1 hypothetical protein [Cellulomonas sp. APG4]